MNSNPAHLAGQEKVGTSIAAEVSLRDYFAAKALPGLLTNISTYSKELERLRSAMPLDDLITKLAYVYADSMLKARAR